MRMRQRTVLGRNPECRRKSSGQYARKVSGVMVPQERHINAQESRDLLERKSQDYFKFSGEEFSRLYRAGVLNANHPKVAKLGVLVNVIDPE